MAKRSLCQQIIALGDAGSAFSRSAEVCGGFRDVAGAFIQVSACSIEAIVCCDACIRDELVELRATRRGPVHHGRGDGAVKRDHRIVTHAFEQLIKGKDLRPALNTR